MGILPVDLGVKRLIVNLFFGDDAREWFGVCFCRQTDSEFCVPIAGCGFAIKGYEVVGALGVELERCRAVGDAPVEGGIGVEL